MLFSILLFLPCAYLFYEAYETASKKYLIAAAIAFGAMTVSYNGTSIVFIGFLLASIAAQRIILRKQLSTKTLITLFTLMAAAFLIGAINQGELYWQNIANSEFCDCEDTSHYMPPIVEPIYLILFIPAFILFLTKAGQNNNLRTFIIISIILLLLFIPYSLLFSKTSPISNYNECLQTRGKGIFSCMNHEKVHRFAFLQDILFILILPAITLPFKKNKPLIALILILLLIQPINIPLYSTGGNEGKVNIADLKEKNQRITAPILLIEASKNWQEYAWDDDLSKAIFHIKPNISKESQIAYVVFDEEYTVTKRILPYLIFNAHYKYIYKPKKFFQEYIYSYTYIMNQPCHEELLPKEYEKIYEKGNICIYKKSRLI